MEHGEAQIAGFEEQALFVPQVDLAIRADEQETTGLCAWPVSAAMSTTGAIPELVYVSAILA